ncbi:MAG TPA: hypothetical protein VNI61_05045 [Gemmatimonadales bacterium]|nr:hypothetical protein [Gemmatimonadales bacterium]
MRRHAVRGAYLLGTALLAGGAVGGAEAQTSLSIYSDGRVVVRQSVPRALERGRNTLTLGFEGLDPGTLFSPDTAVAVVSASVRYPTTKDAALRAAAGRTLAFVREKGDTVNATVVRADPPQFRLSDGRLLLELPGEPLFPPGLVRQAPEVEVVIEASRARPRAELAYVTEGAHWQALYQVVLGRGQAAISGTATVTPGTVRAESAAVQLVAGSVARARPVWPRRLESRLEQMQARTLEAEVVPDETVEQAVGETHVYELAGRHTLEPGVPAAVALFPRGSASYAREFVVPGVLPRRGWLGPQPGEASRVPVQVWYILSRKAGTPFGDRPLPAGTVQLYQPDSAGRVQLIGEALIEHTAPGRDVRVQSGDAFDLTAERVQTDFNQEQLPPPRRGMPARQRVTAAYRVTITSAKAEAVTVDVRESRVGNWRVVESSVPPEKLSATEVRFRVPVPARGEAVLTYTVQLES